MLIISKGPSELLSSLDVVLGNIEALGGTSDRAGGNVESPSVKALQCDLESLSSLSNQVSLRYFAIF
jgi:hypothetical protein